MLKNLTAAAGGKPEQVGFQQALSHAKDKQRDICGWLKLPPTQSMVNILRKTDIEVFSPSLLRRLAFGLEGNDELIKLLSHQKRAMSLRGDMKLKASVRKFQSLRQIAEFAEKTDWQYMELIHQLKEVMKAKLQAEKEARRRKRAEARQARMVQRRVERIRKTAKPEQYEWHPPPIPGNVHIVPITS